jgi:hypothetical protein
MRPCCSRCTADVIKIEPPEGYTPERVQALYRAKALFYPSARAKAAE